MLAQATFATGTTRCCGRSMNQSNATDTPVSARSRTSSLAPKIPTQCPLVSAYAGAVVDAPVSSRTAVHVEEAPCSCPTDA